MSERWARVAAVLLFSLALPLVAFGGLHIAEGLPRLNEQSFAALESAIGSVILVYGIGHLVSAWYVWRGRPWARWLGIGVALLGLAIAAMVLPTAFNTGWAKGGPNTEEWLQAGPEWRSVLIGLSIVPYGLIIVSLSLAGQHFGRPSVRPR